MIHLFEKYRPPLEHNEPAEVFAHFQHECISDLSPIEERLAIPCWFEHNCHGKVIQLTDSAYRNWYAFQFKDDAVLFKLRWS